MKVEIRDTLKEEFNRLQQVKNTSLTPQATFEEFASEAIRMELEFIQELLYEKNNE